MRAFFAETMIAGKIAVVWESGAHRRRDGVGKGGGSTSSKTLVGCGDRRRRGEGGAPPNRGGQGRKGNA